MEGIGMGEEPVMEAGEKPIGEVFGELSKSASAFKISVLNEQVLISVDNYMYSFVK